MDLPFALPPGYLLPVLGYFFLANALALVLFGFNRASSEDGDWGGPEMRVLFLSIMGGWIGARLGRMMYPADAEPRRFVALLNLSVLVLPIVVATPFLLSAVPGWIGNGIATYSAQYAEGQRAAADARIDPVGAASQKKDDAAAPDASGVVASAEDSPAVAIAAAGGKIGDAVATAAATEANAPVLPKRFGPGSEKRGKKGGIKILSVASN